MIVKKDRTWFFTNEKNVSFIKDNLKNLKLENVLACGGGADFAFNLLSLFPQKINNIIIFDNRDSSLELILFKMNLIKKFNRKEFIDFIEKNKKNFKKTKKYYSDSFFAFKKKKDYLVYLAGNENYNNLKNNLNKIYIKKSDFLKLEKKDYNLIYISNLLDYFKKSIRNKFFRKNSISANTYLYLLTQKNSKRLLKKINKFEVIKRQQNNFNVVKSLFGDYFYDSILLRKL